MGSFSWMRADFTTDRANIVPGDKYKILIPEAFGGGYILDTYPDYGHVFDEDEAIKSKYVDGEGKTYAGNEFPMNDLYGILAWWNANPHNNNLSYYGDKKPVTMYDILQNGLTALQENRHEGIEMGCYDTDADKLKFPLKLVSASCSLTYEQCGGMSYSDNDQGFWKKNWGKNSQKEKILKERMKNGYSTTLREADEMNGLIWTLNRILNNYKKIEMSPNDAEVQLFGFEVNQKLKGFMLMHPNFFEDYRRLEYHTKQYMEPGVSDMWNEKLALFMRTDDSFKNLFKGELPAEEHEL